MNIKRIIKTKNFLKTGVGGIVFVPLLIWLIFSLLQISKTEENGLITLFFNPINVVFGILFFIFIVYHLYSEITYIIKDDPYYITAKTLILLINILMISLFIISIIKINISSILVI